MPHAPARDALIVTGGRGTRLQPLTFTTRKELLPFCGVPFLTGVIRRLAAAGVERVHLVAGADTEPFAVLEGDARDAGVVLEVVPEPQPLDTAGGVHSVLDRLSSPFLVLNGDILTDLDYREAVTHHRRTGADGTIALTRVEDTSSYGVCVRDGTRITAFVEKPEPGSLPGQDAVNAGTYVLEPQAFEGYAQGRLSFERQVFPGMLDRSLHLEGFVWDGVWADLGTPDRFRHGHRLALAGRLDWPRPAGVASDAEGRQVHPGATVDADATLEPPVMLLAGARVGPGAIVGPDVVVGERTAVGAGCRLSDSVLFDDVVVGPGIAASGLIAGRGARIEPGAVLGRGVVLGDGEIVPGDAEVADGQRIPPRTG